MTEQSIKDLSYTITAPSTIPQPTVPGAEWEGVRDATKDAEPCAQAALGIVAGVEDCLNLYVYTPKVGGGEAVGGEGIEGKGKREKEKKYERGTICYGNRRERKNPDASNHQF